MINNISFDPLLPWWLMVIVVVGAGFGVWRALPRRWPRILVGLAVAMMAVLLLNPLWIARVSVPLPDKLLLVEDTTLSNTLGSRPAATKANLAAAIAWANDHNLEIWQAPATGQNLNAPDVAGVVVVGDGNDLSGLEASPVPVSVWLSDDPRRPDASLTLMEAPGFGMVGQAPKVILNATAPVGTRLMVFSHGEMQTLTVPEGGHVALTLPALLPGENSFYARLEALPEEEVFSNNAVAWTINGVRERLRVLLVSGQPHPGTRVWRSLLLRDPAVELVHFTILRRPDSLDVARREDMALIPFPVDELFGDKLQHFDIVILDQYTQRGLLPDSYLENIALFHRRGGALLLLTGAEYGGAESLYNSPLAPLLPMIPLGSVLPGAFSLTTTRPHPVTTGLETFAVGEVVPVQAELSLLTAGNNPVLALADAVLPAGRVAQINAGTFWQAARTTSAGAAYRQVLQRLTQWLLRVPGYEADAPHLVTGNNGVTIEGGTLETPSGVGTSTGDAIPGWYAARTTAGNVHSVLAWHWDDMAEIAHLGVNEKAAHGIARRTGGQVLFPNDPANFPVSLRKAQRILGEQRRPLLPFEWVCGAIVGLLVAGWRKSL
ncbi:MAG: hypothetical protein ACK5O1_08085 [Holosporales bacterium]